CASSLVPAGFHLRPGATGGGPGPHALLGAGAGARGGHEPAGRFLLPARGARGRRGGGSRASGLSRSRGADGATGRAARPVRELLLHSRLRAGPRSAAHEFRGGGQPRQPPGHGSGQARPRRAGKEPGDPRGARLLLQGPLAPDVLRELHPAHPHGAPRLAARVAGAGLPLASKGTQPAHLSRGHALHRRRDQGVQGLARLSGPHQPRGHLAHVPRRHLRGAAQGAAGAEVAGARGPHRPLPPLRDPGGPCEGSAAQRAAPGGGPAGGADRPRPAGWKPATGPAGARVARAGASAGGGAGGGDRGAAGSGAGGEEGVSELTLVTGATGFLGAHLVSLLRGHRPLRVLTRAATRELEEAGVEIVEGSLLDAEVLDQALRGGGRVYHAVGLVSRGARAAKEMYRVHVEGPRLLFERARVAGVKRILLVSTSGTIAVSAKEEVFDESAPYPMERVRR